MLEEEKKKKEEQAALDGELTSKVEVADDVEKVDRAVYWEVFKMSGGLKLWAFIITVMTAKTYLEFWKDDFFAIWS
jgi:hypothetical protein